MVHNLEVDSNLVEGSLGDMCQEVDSSNPKEGISLEDINLVVDNSLEEGIS